MAVDDTMRGVAGTVGSSVQSFNVSHEKVTVLIMYTEAVLKSFILTLVRFADHCIHLFFLNNYCLSPNAIV